jgi:hypothetical protein
LIARWPLSKFAQNSVPLTSNSVPRSVLDRFECDPRCQFSARLFSTDTSGIPPKDGLDLQIGSSQTFRPFLFISTSSSVG